jgi:DNA repair protein RadC
MTSNLTRDVCALGASSLPTKDLLALALRRRDDDELREAERALSLHGAARDAALRAMKAGPQLLAVVELGRRAWMLPSPAGRRVRAPVDVAAVVAPRALSAGAQERPDEELVWLLALDARLTLARLVAVPAEPRALLRGALVVGASRIVVACTRPARAVPTSDDARFVEALLVAARTVGVSIIDVVILGDDGFASLSRLGMVPHADPRYR